MNHLLIQRATAKPIPSRPVTPPTARYSVVCGMWIDTRTGEPLVRSEDWEPPQTKKADVERGEDQKGY